MNTRSLIEAELIGVDDVISIITCKKLFLEAQGIDIKTHIVFQDNTVHLTLRKRD